MEFVRDESVYSESNMRYIENEYIKLGFNMAIGGAITYLAEHGEENMINSHDWGRQIQMSYYSGPSPFSPKGVNKRERWKNFSWNPIQSGDCFFNKSKVIDSKFTKDTAYIKCIPMQWALENYPGDCTFEVWAKLEGKTVHVTSRVNANREDKTQYLGAAETPAIYTNGRYYRGITYLGDKPFTNAPLTVICDKEKTKNRWDWHTNVASEYWMALVDDNDYGIGVYCGRAGLVHVGFSPSESKLMGWGTEKDVQTGYIAPCEHFMFDHNLVHTYEYDLIIGDLNFIRKTANEFDKNIDHKKFVFKDRRYGFRYKNIVDQGYPIQDCLKFDFVSDSAIDNVDVVVGKDCSKLLLDAKFSNDLRGKLICKVYKGLDEYMERILEDVEINFYLNSKGERKIHEIDFSSIKEMFCGFEIKFESSGSVELYSIEIK